MKTFHVLLALSCSLALVGAPGLVRAQDDDMPDGDVDIIEKPKPKKREKKKEEPKKEEPKKAEKPKEEPKPKEEKPKKEPKEKAPPPSDDDDILTGGDSGAKIAPKTDKAPPPPPPRASDDDEDADDEGEGSGRTRLLKSIEDGPAPVVDGEDDVPARAKPLAIDDGALDDVPARRDPDEGSRSPIVVPSDDRGGIVGGGGDGDGDGDGDGEAGAAAATIVETGPTGDENGGLDEDGANSTWVIVGATAGGVLLLAGAGVGGFFLVDALTPKTGTVTVTPR